jgi:uncharacterized protein (DUF2141 family)
MFVARVFRAKHCVRDERKMNAMGRLVLAVFFLLCALPAEAADATLFATLTVSVDGVQGGAVHVALYDEPTFGGMPLEVRSIRGSGTMQVRFSRLPPGLYALRAFQDANGNGRLDAGERVGFTGGAHCAKTKARAVPCRPTFDKAAVMVNPGSNSTIIHLR